MYDSSCRGFATPSYSRVKKWLDDLAAHRGFDARVFCRVCREFFEFIQVLVDCFPNALAQMDPAQFQSVMESLAWGLDADVDTEQTQRLCLQTMAASDHLSCVFLASLRNACWSITFVVAAR